MTLFEKLIAMHGDVVRDRVGYSVGVGVGTASPSFVRCKATAEGLERAIEEAWERWEQQKEQDDGRTR